MNAPLKQLLSKSDGILLSSPGNIVYLTHYSGFSETERECFLLLTQKKKYLITDKRYSEAVKKIAKNFEVIDFGANNFTKMAKVFFKEKNIKVLGFEENDLKVSEYKLLNKAVKLKPMDLSCIRLLKTKDEVKNIKLACKTTDQAFDFIIGKLKAGVSELQIALELELFVKQKNAQFSFDPIIAFGRNSSVPHHQTGNTKLKNNQIVLLDFGVKVNNYCSDMSRTVFFGKASEKFKRMHEVALEAQTKAIKTVAPGISASKIDKVARDFIIKEGFPNIIHSVGHGTGILVHESPHLSPNSKDKIQTGMVFSVEPGIYLEDFGGVRIEDLVLVTKKGAELISRANRNIIEI